MDDGLLGGVFVCMILWLWDILLLNLSVRNGSQYVFMDICCLRVCLLTPPPCARKLQLLLVIDRFCGEDIFCVSSSLSTQLIHSHLLGTYLISCSWCSWGHFLLRQSFLELLVGYCKSSTFSTMKAIFFHGNVDIDLLWKHPYKNHLFFLRYQLHKAVQIISRPISVTSECLKILVGEAVGMIEDMYFQTTMVWLWLFTDSLQFQVGVQHHFCFHVSLSSKTRIFVCKIPTCTFQIWSVNLLKLFSVMLWLERVSLIG